MFLIPSFLLNISCMITYVSLTMIAASVYQMLRGSIIIFTTILSVVFMGRKMYRHHLASLATIFIGLLLVYLAVILENGEDPST